MLLRDCAGGVVFWEDQVLLIQNDKGEWSFPKGVIREGELQDDVAVSRVEDEASIQARILSLAGRTNYEFYSWSRKRPVANRIVWYIMTCDSPDAKANQEQGFRDARFFPIDVALETVTYSQDRSLLMLANQKYRELADETDDR